MTQALAALGGLFGNQSRRTVERQPMPSAIEAMTVAKDTRHLNKIRKQAREERLLSMLNQPEVLGFLMAFGGFYAANNIPFASGVGNEAKNALLQGIASTMAVAMGMGYAGVGDLTGLSVATAAGGASIFGSLLGDVDLNDSSLGSDWYKYLFPWGGLWGALT